MWFVLGTCFYFLYVAGAGERGASLIVAGGVRSRLGEVTVGALLVFIFYFNFFSSSGTGSICFRRLKMGSKLARVDVFSFCRSRVKTV